MKELSLREQLIMDQSILIAASKYAMKISGFKEQLEQIKPELNEDMKLEKRYDIESQWFVQKEIIMLARSVTHDDELATYETLNDDMLSFKDEVNNNLDKPYYIYYKDGMIYLARLVEEESINQEKELVEV
ncbi:MULTISPECIES: hypothetical protein [Bacillus cereus group]|uniref:hypothetical protein n=1 Tax=Bacillus cereus group TaxID=86661 RepID=UPI001298CE80|nr:MULTISPECIES: hypothetical protein [Bacillus cereus group]MEB9419961.1 hypothetical protein [Bacillus cereus]MEB9509446.1 hypothetical protein [Bacillus cereus]MEB9561542.1 hypothetical protein [Bacillus cereus]MRC02862.1 hypothetical protein [Bacillus thuringiensis]MRC76550.1 hypothetical protein [Bacillus thuringiensis]